MSLTKVKVIAQNLSIIRCYHGLSLRPGLGQLVCANSLYWSAFDMIELNLLVLEEPSFLLL